MYAKLPSQTEFVAHSEPSVKIVNALSGAGMTLSWGFAEESIAGWDESSTKEPVRAIGDRSISEKIAIRY